MTVEKLPSNELSNQLLDLIALRKLSAQVYPNNDGLLMGVAGSFVGGMIGAIFVQNAVDMGARIPQNMPANLLAGGLVLGVFFLLKYANEIGRRRDLCPLQPWDYDVRIYDLVNDNRDTLGEPLFGKVYHYKDTPQRSHGLKVGQQVALPRPALQ